MPRFHFKKLRYYIVLISWMALGCATAPSVTREPSLTHHDATKTFADHVVIISIDGLRPDLLIPARTPHLRALLHESSYSFWAVTVEDPYVYTLPAHVSMLTGVAPDRHGVTWNDYIEQSFPAVPTLFQCAKGKGLTTGLVSGKMKFITFAEPGALDWFYIPPDEPVDDVQFVAGHATRLLREHQPNVLFMHLPGVDTAGHSFGWGSREQLAAVERADIAVGEVLTALRSLEMHDSTLLIVTADHGGAGMTHGGADARSRTIPWIVRGPRIRKAYDLSLVPTLTIRTEDTFATACVAMGIPLPDGIKGRFVKEMLVNTRE